MSAGQPTPARSAHPFHGARVLRPAGKVLPGEARGFNRALVLQTVFHVGAMSRADIARETGLTRVTVSDLVAELMSEGILRETGRREANGPGKPAIVVDLDRDGNRIIALDLSRADVIAGAVMSLTGEVLTRREIALPADRSVIAEAGRTIVRELIAEVDVTIVGIGAGTPGLVDEHGVVRNAPNLGWSDFDLAGYLTADTGLPVLVANDANAAVRAEYTFGNARDDVLLVKVDHGVGAGLLSDGRPLSGARFAAGEIGHVTVGTSGGPPCACGRVGCLEAWLSVPALTARLALADDESERAHILRSAGAMLGVALAPVVAALDLTEIVVSGPVDLLAGPLIEEAQLVLRERTLSTSPDRVTVRMTEQGDDIVLVGAAVTVLSGRLGVS